MAKATLARFARVGRPPTPALVQQVIDGRLAMFTAVCRDGRLLDGAGFTALRSHPVKRSSMQPSVVLAALAAANFIKSSEQENGAAGRSWALTLLQEAQASLESSINARWIDESLVQASWVRLRSFPSARLAQALTHRLAS